MHVGHASGTSSRYQLPIVDRSRKMKYSSLILSASFLSSDHERYTRAVMRMNTGKAVWGTSQLGTLDEGLYAKRLSLRLASQLQK